MWSRFSGGPWTKKQGRDWETLPRSNSGTCIDTLYRENTPTPTPTNIHHIYEQQLWMCQWGHFQWGLNWRIRSTLCIGCPSPRVGVLMERNFVREKASWAHCRCNVTISCCALPAKKNCIFPNCKHKTKRDFDLIILILTWRMKFLTIMSVFNQTLTQFKTIER